MDTIELLGRNGDAVREAIELGDLVFFLYMPLSFIKTLYISDHLVTSIRTVQARHGFAAYTLPTLVGYASGATLVYAILAQSPANTFVKESVLLGSGKGSVVPGFQI